MAILMLVHTCTDPHAGPQNNFKGTDVTLFKIHVFLYTNIIYISFTEAQMFLILALKLGLLFCFYYHIDLGVNKVVCFLLYQGRNSTSLKLFFLKAKNNRERKKMSTFQANFTKMS